MLSSTYVAVHLIYVEAAEETEPPEMFAVVTADCDVFTYELKEVTFPPLRETLDAPLWVILTLLAFL